LTKPILCANGIDIENGKTESSFDGVFRLDDTTEFSAATEIDTAVPARKLRKAKGIQSSCAWMYYTRRYGTNSKQNPKRKQGTVNKLKKFPLTVLNENR